MAQQMTNPDIICSFYSARMEAEILKTYFESGMDLNHLSLSKFEDEGPGNAKYA
jgi:hypothetical protein